MKHSILLVFAHPDDETSSSGGITAKYTRQGVPVDLVCATRGEKGTRLDVPDNMSTGEAREAELRAVAALLGIRNIYFLDYTDAEMTAANPAEITNKVLKIMRRVQPEVVITFGPDGVSGHGDHIAISQAATAAFKKFDEMDDELRRLYHVAIPESAVPEGSGYGITTYPDDEVSTIIDIREYIEKKIQALDTYSSQQDAREFAETLRQNRELPFANKEFFTLANSTAPTRETELFH